MEAMKCLYQELGKVLTPKQTPKKVGGRIESSLKSHSKLVKIPEGADDLAKDLTETWNEEEVSRMRTHQQFF